MQVVNEANKYLDEAKKYLEFNKDEKHSIVISRYLQENNTEKLKELLGSRMSFGTAGLRGSLGPGLNQMNSLVVLQTTQGVISVLEEEYHTLENWKELGVVIGYDHRHESKDFAYLIAGSFIGKGIKVYLFRDLVHTPMVPFAVCRYNALCGIMITASHNPKQDNGYKLYWKNGCQIIPPIDKKIALAILRNLKPWNWNPELADKSIDPSDSINEYFEKIRDLKRFKDDGKMNLSYCYTAMHGVGYQFAKKAFKVFGLSRMIPVEEQVIPDPDFPTVEYPNPEEGEGALKLAIKTATENDCQIILANDPDADRLAVAERLPNGEWYIFTGNELGTILGTIAYEAYKERNLNVDISKLVLLASTVSSRFLEIFARKEGLQFQETLSGFKWLGNKALDLKKDGYIPIFAFEEAIGYMIGDIVADKDGISSLAFISDYINHLYGKNMTLLRYLNDLYERYGFVHSENGYFKCYSPDKILQIFSKFRYGNNSGSKLSYPKKVGHLDILTVRDLTVGYDSSQPDNIPVLPVSSSSQMITLTLSNGCTFTVRTSGTEPKIKYYSEIMGTDLKSMQQELHNTVEALIELILEPISNNLIPK